MSIADEIEKLEGLHRSGALSDEEFERAKAEVLEPGSRPSARREERPARTEQETRQWAMFLHLSQFAGYLVPLAGLVVPIVIWQIKKATLPGIDRHGKVVMNWILSEILYLVLGTILVFMLIGIPLLIALGVVAIVFPIIGAIKAADGELWRYPMSMPFFTIESVLDRRRRRRVART